MMLIHMAQDQEILPTISRLNTIMLKLQDLLLLMLKRRLIHGELDLLQTQDQLFPMLKLEQSQMVTHSTMEFFPIPSKRPTLMLKLLDKPLLMLKRNLIHGETDGPPTPDQSHTHMDLFKLEKSQMDMPSTMEFSHHLLPRPKWKLKILDKLLLISNLLLMYGEMDGLKTLVQSTHMDLFKDKPTQMDTLSTVESFLIQLKQLTMLLRSKDKLLLMLKRNLMPGEKDLLQTQAQFLNLSKREPTQMVTLTTVEYSLIQLKQPTMLLKLLDKHLLMLKRNLIPGETDGLLTQDQSFNSPNIEPTQMDIPITMVSFLTLSSRLTPMLRLPELLPLMPKRNQMPGETDLLLTQDQSLTMSKREPTQMVTPSTTVSFLTQSSRLTPMLRLPELLPLMPKRNQMPGETDGLLTQDQLLTTLKYKIQTPIQSQTDMLNHTTTWLVI